MWILKYLIGSLSAIIQSCILYFTGNDAKAVQKKIDNIQARYTELREKVSDSAEQMEEALPLAKNFNEAHAKFLDWVLKIEPQLRAKEPTGPEAEEQVQVYYHKCVWILFHNVGLVLSVSESSDMILIHCFNMKWNTKDAPSLWHHIKQVQPWT